MDTSVTLRENMTRDKLLGENRTRSELHKQDVHEGIGSLGRSLTEEDLIQSEEGCIGCS